MGKLYEFAPKNPAGTLFDVNEFGVVTETQAVSEEDLRLQYDVALARGDDATISKILSSYPQDILDVVIGANTDVSGIVC